MAFFSRLFGPRAAPVSRENAEINQINRRMTVCRGQVLELQGLLSHCQQDGAAFKARLITDFTGGDLPVNVSAESVQAVVEERLKLLDDHLMRLRQDRSNWERMRAGAI